MNETQAEIEVPRLSTTTTTLPRVGPAIQLTVTRWRWRLRSSLGLETVPSHHLVDLTDGVVQAHPGCCVGALAALLPANMAVFTDRQPGQAGAGNGRKWSAGNFETGNISVARQETSLPYTRSLSANYKNDLSCLCPSCMQESGSGPTSYTALHTPPHLLLTHHFRIIENNVNQQPISINVFHHCYATLYFTRLS